MPKPVTYKYSMKFKQTSQPSDAATHCAQSTDSQIILVLCVLIGNTLEFSPLYAQNVNDKRYILLYYNNNKINTVSLSTIAHVVNILACVRKKTSQYTGYPEILFSFPSSLPKAGRASQVSHDCFYLHLSKFILHYHPATGR